MTHKDGFLKHLSGMAAVSAFTTLTAAAQTATENAPALTWQEILEYGGWIMYVLAFLSVLALAFVIYFFTVLRPSQVAPPKVIRELLNAIRAGETDKARHACEDTPSALSAVALAALDHMRDVPNVDASLLKDVMEGEGARQAESIQGQTQYLMDIAVISPMVGLLGTVFGMLRAFSSIALDIAKAKPVELAGGVSQALITTAFGLMVGIPAMVFYAYFRRQSSKMVSHLESHSTDLLTALLSRR